MDETRDEAARDEAMPYGVDTIRLRISFPAAPASQEYDDRMWRMRPLRGWTGGARWDEEAAARAEHGGRANEGTANVPAGAPQQVSVGSSLRATLDRVIAAMEASAVKAQGGGQLAQAEPPIENEATRGVEPGEPALSDAEVLRLEIYGKLRSRLKEIDPENPAPQKSYLTGRGGFVPTEADLEALGQTLNDAHGRQSGIGNGVPDVAPSSPVNVRSDESMTDASPDPISTGQRYAQAQLAIPAFRFAAPYVARGLGVLLGAGAGTLLLNEGQEQKPPETPEAGPPSNVITPRPDVVPQAGGRSGELVAGLKGPPNSAIPAAGPGRIFITDETGKVVVEVTRKRAKFIREGGRWGKRNPTPQEIELLDKVGR